MKIFKPSYYDDFRCIAADCPDSCCHEWSVSVDEDAAAFYRNLPGDLGDRLRQVLREEDGDTILAIENGRCPMWRLDGLCRIQAELGHDALCKTCREFPRLVHDYGDFQQWQLELSCPEAARWILGATADNHVEKEIPGGETPEYDPADMEILLKTKETALKILNEETPIPQRLATLLLFSYHAQSDLDSGEIAPFDPQKAWETVRELEKNHDQGAFLSFFGELEILTDRWKERLSQPEKTSWDDRYGALARYFVERYWLQAISDFDLAGRGKLCVISCLAIHLLGGDLLETAQLYSKEIENNPENVWAILDGAYAHRGLTDAQLLGLLLEDMP